MVLPDLSTSTHRLVSEGAVFDAHADSLQRALDLGHDLGVRGPGHMDLERGRAGGVGAQVFVCWVDPAYLEAPGGTAARTNALLAEFHALVARHPDRVAWCGNGTMLDAARAGGRVAGIPGIEGGHSLNGDLDQLRAYFQAGVRVLTLVWNNHLDWIRSCQPGAGPGVPAGLSPFGRRVIETMNELGMVVDLAHAGERSFYEALEASQAPVLASHSGCMAENRHPRNLTDDQLRALAAAGGVACMVFCTPFLDADAQAAERAARETEAYRALRGEGETGLWLAQSEYLQAHVAPLPMERFLDHLMHAIEVCGIEHVGLGSDYDGIQRAPQGLEDASCYPRLMEALFARGLDEGDVRRVMGGNVERVFREVTGPGTAAATAGVGAQA